MSDIDTAVTADRVGGPDGGGERCLTGLFASTASEVPAATALVCGQRQYSYSQLDQASDRMARRLRQLGAGPGGIIALWFGRSELPVMAVVGCLKSGAAYLGIDAALPDDRIRHMADEARVSLCLTDGANAARAGDVLAGAAVVTVDHGWGRDGLCSASSRREEAGQAPSDLAYVIYTSGTTGRPKGVMAEHGHVVRYVEAFNELCATGPQDRVYQGFPLSFDGSVEEMWMAFSNGSALVVPTDDAPRFGSDLSRHLAGLGITYFSTVPTLLSTLTPDIPSLRTLVLSGETCPPELVNRWARPGLRILNVYGPTEATVNTTAAECVAGRSITIGRPLPGYEVHVVDRELRTVPPGESGELLISGHSLARGYLGRPDLTAERFLTLDLAPDAAPIRCYRTGDLARWNHEGDLEFLGRLDGQVKIRGYRVELAEIESVLLEHPQIRSASVRLFEAGDHPVLAAYVVLDAAAHELDRIGVLSLLESKLPAYMVPGALDVLAALPRTPSGKVDREQLPVPVEPLVRHGPTATPPANAMERALAEVWRETLGISSISVDDDFFADLGGYSLLAGRMVTRLRERLAQPVTLRDAYEFSTIRRLAAHLGSIGSDAEEREDRPPGDASGGAGQRAPGGPSGWERLAIGTLQGCSSYVVFGVAMAPLLLVFMTGLGWVEGRISSGRLVALNVLVVLLAWPALLALSVAAKWMLIGRYRPGEHKLWGFYYWRWWLTERLRALSGAGALAGTPLLPLYYRLMGARVGARCTIDTLHCSIWDTVVIGDDVSIGADTQLLGYRVEDGMLRLGRIHIGNRCFVGMHCALGLDVVMGDDSRLDDQSLLPDGDVLPAGEGRRGSPARAAEITVPAGVPAPPRWRRALFGVAHLTALEGLLVALLVPPMVVLQCLTWQALSQGQAGLGGVALVAAVPAAVALYCVYVAALKRVILRRVEPGTYPILGFVYLRKWLSDELMAFTRFLLLPVYTTLYLPPLLRLMGARIAPRAEISTVWRFAPELIEVGEESFFADGSIVGGRRCHRGLCEISENRIGRRSFVGNSAVLPVGTSLGDRCLLGVQSIPPPGRSCVPDGTEWLGSPSFPLTNRPRAGGFDEAVTYRPTARLYLQRAAIDGLRILFPAYVSLAAIIGSAVLLLGLRGSLGFWPALALAPGVGLALALCSVLAVVALKRIVMGTYGPEVRPLWSMYVWLNEMVNGAYESLVAPVIGLFLGSPFAAWFLRLMGCRIGRSTYIGTTLFSEFDLVEVGDHAALNHGAVIQNHLFEDRVFKSSSVTIGDGASVGNMSVILYDSEIEAGARVGPLSLLMKGEVLGRRTRWHGIPTLPVEARSPARPEGART